MLKTLVCLLLAMASMSHDQREHSEENMQCHGKVSSSFHKTTAEGNQIPRSQMHCEIKSEQLPIKYHFDIASVLQPRVPNDTLSYLDIEIECNSPIELYFTNLHSLVNKNVLSNLIFWSRYLRSKPKSCKRERNFEKRHTNTDSHRILQ